MSDIYLGTGVILLMTILIGLRQVFKKLGGPNSLLAALLFGTTGVGLILVVGKEIHLPSSIDVALVFALLAAVLGVAFVLRGWPEKPNEDTKA